MNKNNIFWAIIPARSGSQSVRHKNIIKVKGKPLIAYTILAAKKISKVNKVLVSSDSKNYLKIAKKYGADILHHRSKKSSTNTATDLSFFKEIIQHYRSANYDLPKFFLHLRPNCPIRKTRILNKAVSFFLNNNIKYSSVRSVSKMSESSYKTFEIKNNLLKGLCGQSHDIEKMNKPKEFFKSTYMANGYIDIIKVENIYKNILHGDRSFPFEIKESVVDIDSKNELLFAKYLLNKK
jgi:CMP-N,N'-diacetyllegionaminic acid synthase